MKVKVLDTRYVVKVDGLERFSEKSLREARMKMRSVPTDTIGNKVDIVRQNVVESQIESYVPKTTTVLVASDLGNDLEGADNADAVQYEGATDAQQ